MEIPVKRCIVGIRLTYPITLISVDFYNCFLNFCHIMKNIHQDDGNDNKVTKFFFVGTYDFFGLNHYTTHLVSHAVSNISVVSYANDQDLTYTFDASWPR